MNKGLLLAGVACLFATAANAELTPYVGADYTYSMRRMDTAATRALVDHSVGVTAVAGVRLNKWAGLEAFYQITKPETNHLGATKFHDRMQAYGLDAIGYLPLGCDQKFELLAGAGLGEYEMKVRANSIRADKFEGYGYRLTAGAQYNLDEHWTVRGTYRHVYVNKTFLNDLNEVSLGLRYNF